MGETKVLLQRYQRREICRDRADAALHSEQHQVSDAGSLRGVLRGAVFTEPGVPVVFSASVVSQVSLF